MLPVSWQLCNRKTDAVFLSSDSISMEKQTPFPPSSLPHPHPSYSTSNTSRYPLWTHQLNRPWKKTHTHTAIGLLKIQRGSRKQRTKPWTNKDKAKSQHLNFYSSQAQRQRHQRKNKIKNRHSNASSPEPSFPIIADLEYANIAGAKKGH